MRTIVSTPHVELRSTTASAPASTVSAPATADGRRPASWLDRLIAACSKPMMAVSLGAQLLFGALPAGATQGAILGTWSPRVEVTTPRPALDHAAELTARIDVAPSAPTVAEGPAARLLAQSAPKLERLRTEARALRDAEQMLPMASNEVERTKLQLRSAEDLLREHTTKRDTLDAAITRLAGGDPVDLAIARDERAAVESEITSQRALVTQLTEHLDAAIRDLEAAKETLTRAERRVDVATRALGPERTRAEHLLAKNGIEVPWVALDRSIEALGVTPPSSEVERVLVFATRVEAWIARSGAVPDGATLTQLAMTPNSGVAWALSSLPRDVVIPADHLPFIARFDVALGVPSARELYTLIGRDTSRIDVRDAEMFARHPASEHRAFLALLDELDGRSGGLVGGLSAFEALWPLVRGEQVELPGQLGNSHTVDRATLLTLVDQAREATGGLSADVLRLFALGALGQPHQRENVAWLRAHARIEGRTDDAAVAERWASFGQPGLATLERLEARVGRPLTIAEVVFATNRRSLAADVERIPQGVALKDVHLATSLDAAIRVDPRLAGDRAALEAAVEAGLGSPVARLDRTYSEDWATAKASLGTADLQKILLVQSALARPEVRASIGAMVREDLSNPNTELGGLVRVVDGRATITLEGGVGKDNNSFTPGLGFDPFEALASFHFHALDAHGHPESAGPSPGPAADLATARSLQLDGLVFTLVAKDRVNVDFYTAHGTVLDLGTLTLR